MACGVFHHHRVEPDFQRVDSMSAYDSDTRTDGNVQKPATETLTVLTIDVPAAAPITPMKRNALLKS